MSKFEDYLSEAEKVSPFRKDLKRLSKEIKAFESALQKVEDAVSKLNESGRAAKSAFNNMDSIRGKKLGNIDTPEEYNTWVLFENFAYAQTKFGELIRDHKTAIAHIRKMM